MAEPWRLIKTPPGDGPFNMAFDEAILRGAEETPAFTPVLRIYGWKRPAISIGYLQDASPFLDAGVPVVRRITGGRAVLHDMEVTYSVVAPVDRGPFMGGIMEAYSVISRSIVDALNDFGAGACLKEGRAGRAGAGRDNRACFFAHSRHEVVVNGRKLSGSAQRRFRNAFLQHGSILFDLNEGLNSRVFGCEAVERMSWVRAVCDAPEEAFTEAVVRRMGEGLGARFTSSGPTEREGLLMDGLINGKYLRDEWNHGSGGRVFADIF